MACRNVMWQIYDDDDDDDDECDLRFSLSRLDLQKNFNVLRYKRITESLISPIILNKMNSLPQKQIKVSQG